MNSGGASVMIRGGNRKRLYPALLASAAYIVFLASSAPHRVHHLFDAPKRIQHTRSAERSAANLGAAHHHHDTDGSHSHAGDESGHETSPEKQCVHLAVFEQHPGSMAELPFSHATPLEVYPWAQPESWLQSTTRVGLQRTRSPPRV